ncbi:MAG: lipid-binding SYLF domain-containing protein [Planctomycetota bacterium]|jgi:lipid-binding SYLF domain-containing protein
MRRILIIAVCAACASNPRPTSETGKRHLHREVDETIAAFKKKDPSIATFFDNAWGYVVFPNVGKGGFIVGAAAGDGEVYEKGKMIGWAGMSQGSIGLQIGGKTFSQIVFFESEVQFAQFKDGHFEFGAGVDAVAADKDAGLNSGYKKGVAVFIDIKEGLMADASASGQQFTFVKQ